MRVLFATTLHPGARSSGGEHVSAAFIDGLRASGHGVEVLGYRRRGALAPPRAAEDLDVGPRAIETRQAGAWPVWWMARALMRGMPYSAAKYDGRGYRLAFADAVARLGDGLVVIDHAQLSWLLEHLPVGPRVVLLAHNVEHRLYAEQARGPGFGARINGREARCVLDRERALCARADAVWALTAADRDRLTALGAHARAFTVPPATAAPDTGPPSCDLALLGTWTWAANGAGLTWWADEVLPLLPPGLQIRVGGAGAAGLAGVPGLEVVERVDDAAAFLRAARTVVVPSVAGAGLQIKTLDAIASGRAVVATPVALRGIDAPPASVRVAGEAGAFADAVRASLTEEVTDAAKVAATWARMRRERFTSELEAAVAEIIG